MGINALFIGIYCFVLLVSLSLYTWIYFGENLIRPTYGGYSKGVLYIVFLSLFLVLLFKGVSWFLTTDFAIREFLNQIVSFAKPNAVPTVSALPLSHADANSYLGNQINIYGWMLNLMGIALGVALWVGYNDIKRSSVKMAKQEAQITAQKATKEAFEDLKSRYAEHLTPLAMSVHEVKKEISKLNPSPLPEEPIKEKEEGSLRQPPSFMRSDEE